VKEIAPVTPDGREPGLLAYDDGTPGGLGAVARRDEYGQLLRSRVYAPRDEDDGVWSIVCFYVDPRAKRKGVARALLEAAVGHAFARGATAIEAFPHERGDYMGSLELFAEAGFEPLRVTGKRTLVRCTS
jgi:GNAT superfamily N-acetyltransferase